jgi:hypothetical protein
MKTNCLSELFFHIAHHAWEDQDELKISDSDLKKIMELKVKTKKESIHDKAEIETLGVDIFAALWDEKADTAAINKIIDKKFELKRESMKRLAGSFFALKNLFTKEQMKTLKELCRRQKCFSENKGKEKEPGSCR